MGAGVRFRDFVLKLFMVAAAVTGMNLEGCSLGVRRDFSRRFTHHTGHFLIQNLFAIDVHLNVCSARASCYGKSERAPGYWT